MMMGELAVAVANIGWPGAIVLSTAFISAACIAWSFAWLLKA
jgi:hypothetical protein